MSTTDTPVDNGVNVAALLGAREALTAAPEAAQFNGGQLHVEERHHSSSTVEQFFGLGEEQRHRQVYTFDADHPEIFASERQRGDAGRVRARRPRQLPHRRVRGGRPEPRDPTAVGIGHARRRHGRLGILGIDSDIRNGFSGIKVTYDIDADATPDEIKALVAQSQKRSACYDIITNPTNVTSRSAERTSRGRP
jgi:hypothetical protein